MKILCLKKIVKCRNELRT